jgi:hypothetical protein
MYWRRRVLLLGVPLVLVALVAYSCSGVSSAPLAGPTGSAPTPVTSGGSPGIIIPSNVPTGSAPPPQSYPTAPPVSGTATATDVAATGPGGNGDGAGSGGSGSGTGSGSGGSGVGSAGNGAGGTGCLMQIAVHLDKSSSSGPVTYAAGQYPTFGVSAQDEGSANCRIDVSGKGLVVTVTSVGSATAAWSSAVCSGAADVRELGPGDGYSESVAWPRYQSDASCPTTNKPTVGPGAYTVSAAADGITAASVQFVLN